MDPKVDAAHVPAPLAVDQGESSWLCAELISDSGRRLAVLVWLHRTGPRLSRFEAGLGLLDHDQLPALARELIPSWLPIVTPVKVRTDGRPLLMMVVYDLDRPERAPLQVEETVESFDPRTFSAATGTLALQLANNVIVIEARTSQFHVRLEARARKQAVFFGEGSPILRHGDIEVGYLQRSRLDVNGSIQIEGEPSLEVTGEGAHDRHWRTATVPGLAWLWIHLRLEGEREINAYVIRERGRGGWWIDADARVHTLGNFVLEQQGERYTFEAPALDLRIEFVHAVDHPYLRMRAFGEAMAGGISEAPIRVTASSTANVVSGWLEVFDAATCAAI